MTQVKSKKKLPQKEVEKLKNTPQLNMRGDFFKLSADEQAAVTNFFSLHNAAVWIHSKLSKQAQDFVQKCIALSTEHDSVEEDRPVSPSKPGGVQFGG